MRAVSDLERGVKLRPRAYTVRQLADALCLSPEDRSVFEDAARGRVSTDREPDSGSVSPPPVGAFLGAMPEQGLVARDLERSALVTYIDEAAAGHGRLVLLSGEAGAGKTRLAQEAVLLARERGFLCATGRCHAPDTGATYAPVLDVLATLYAACPDALRAELPRRWPYLAWLLPDAGLVPARVGGEGPDERQRLFRAVAGFLQALSAQHPVAVLLDDLHWADGSTLSLLAHLARQAPGYRIFLLGTYRYAEVTAGHAFAPLVRDLEREELLAPIAVRPFGLEGTADLLAAWLDGTTPPEALVSYVYRLSDGNPFFVRHLFRSLLESGVLAQREDRLVFTPPAVTPLPASVRSLIGGRLAHLGDTPVQIMREASVLGQTFSFMVLQTMGARSEEEVEAALEKGGAAGLVRPLDADLYAFDHALTHQALLAELTPHRIRRLHRAAGDALEQSGSTDAAALAWHLRHGGASERALPYALLAGDRAVTVFAHEEAAAQYRMAADLAGDIGDVAQEALAFERLGGVLMAEGQPDGAVAACEEAIERYHAVNDLEGEGRATAVLADAQIARGAPADGHVRVRAVLERFEGREPSPAVGALYLALAPSRDVGPPQEYLSVVERAAEVARALGDDRLLATAGVRRGLILMVLGRPEAARQVLEEVLPQVERAADYGTRNLGLGVLSELLKLAGDFAACRIQRERMLALAEQVGDPVLLVASRAQLGEICVLMGAWAEARDHLETAAELGRPLPDPHVPAFALTALAELCLAEGKLDEASTHLRTCLAAVEKAGYGHWVRIVQRLLAQVDLLTGHAEDAGSRLRAVASDEQEERAGTLAVLARAILERGDPAEADAASQKALDLAESHDNRLDLCETLLVRGRILAHPCDITEAVDAFQRALTLAEAMPFPFAAGRILYEWGMGLRGTDPVRARERFEAALSTFRGLGAAGYVARTEQALVTIRVGPRHRS